MRRSVVDPLLRDSSGTFHAAGMENLPWKPAAIWFATAQVINTKLSPAGLTRHINSFSSIA